VAYMDKVVRVSDGHYVLPRIGPMLVEIHAFLSEALFWETDERLWIQAVNATCYPGVKAVYLMPDTHVGAHVPIGCVIVTEDTVAQAPIGYDISCGMLAARMSGMHARDVVDMGKRRQWVQAICDRIALGVGKYQVSGTRSFSNNEVEELIRHGAEPLGIKTDLCERLSLPVPDSFDPRKYEKAWRVAAPSMGSLGGGNHFIEGLADPEDGALFGIIHSGSRGFGWKIANHFFYEAAEECGLDRRRREESWIHVDTPLGKEFINAHNAAANYAIANRWVMYKAVEAATQEVFGVDLEPIYEISHNLMQQETLADGTRGFVHRKGATRAMPAKHPDLAGTQWYETGHPCIVPGSMFEGAALLTGIESGPAGYSVNHGSGRTGGGRSQMKRDLADKQDEIDLEMAEIERVFDGVTIRGIAMNTDKTPLDECNRAYKALDEVVDVLRGEGVVRVDRRLYPWANIKGTG
jgi:tRNA-splicing ligase RtcB (3'-phosphate/5'-hydroxy nucleic acid ligase)